jgi:transcriptional regulator with XRE-family HTH domain
LRAHREQDAGFVSDCPGLSGGLNHTAMTATADKISCARATGTESATTTKPQPPAAIRTEATRPCRRLPRGRLFVIVHALVSGLDAWSLRWRNRCARRAAKVSRARPAPKYGLERASDGSPAPILGSAMPRRRRQDVLVATKVPHAGNDNERDHGWPLWGAAIKAALDRREITVNSAASRLGLRNTTLKRWLAGEVPPQLSKLSAIAELTGVSHAVQLELGNVLPPELRSEAHAMQVADELSGAIGRVQDVISRAAELAFSDAGARLAGILLADSEVPLQITLRRAYRGIRYPIHLSTYVGVEGIDADSHDDEILRRQVTKIIGQSARVFGARWREQDAHDWPPPHPELILNVPQHERPRPPSSNAVAGVPNVLMLGCPYAHAEYIGALLADALGYGYIDIRYSLPMPLDKSPTDPQVTKARVEFVSDLARDESITRRNVWSLADHRLLPEIMGTLKGAAVGCAVYVRSEDRLLARGGEVWGVPFDEMLRLRGVIDRLVTSVDWPVLTVVMPDDLLSNDDGMIDRDRVADVSVLAAVDVWMQLRNWRFVPDGIHGRLASMFDARGRPLSDPHISMVREQANMPRRR